jgi:site-specific recombinase XerD
MTQQPNSEALIPKYEGEQTAQHQNIMHRRRVFVEWLTANNKMWYEPNLEDYANYLTAERQLTPHSTSVYLATVRRAYSELLENKQHLLSLLKRHSQTNNQEAIEAAIRMMEVAADSRTARKKVKEPSVSHKHLNIEQVNSLLNMPQSYTLQGLRDVALLATLFATGLRDVEVASLQTSDLYHSVDGKPALHVPACPRCVERLVEYTEMDWVLPVLEIWCQSANIQRGHIFRGFTKNGSIREEGLAARTIQKILHQYPLITEDDDYQQITLLDIRYTYARTLFKAGVPIETIRKNLGFESNNTAIQFIGKLDAPDKKPQVYKIKVDPIREYPDDLDDIPF